MKKILFVFFVFFLLIMSVENVNAESIFKPVNYFNDFAVDSNYIIVAYDQEEDAWFALSPYNENAAVKIDDPRKGIRLTDNEVKNSQYVFKCSKIDTSDYYRQVKLRSNLVDEATGKKYSLYLNKDQIFNLGGGNITLNFNSIDSTGLVPIHMGKHKVSSLFFDSETNSFKYLNNYYDRSHVYVFSDRNPLLVQNEAVKLKKINNVGQLVASFNVDADYNRFQMVYEHSDGKSYILTGDGTKEIEINNGEINTKDYLYFYSDYYVENSEFVGRMLVDGYKLYKGKYLNISNLEFTFTDEESGLFYYYYYVDACPGQTSEMCYLDSKNTPFVSGDLKSITSQETKYYISAAYDVFIGFDDVNKKFIPVPTMDKAVKFDFYTEQELYDVKTVQYFRDNIYDVYYQGFTASNSLRENRRLNINDTFVVGWSTDPNSFGFIDESDYENLFTYNGKLKKRDINPEVKKKYSIVDNLSDVKSSEEVIKLYLVKYNYPEIKESPYIGQVDNKNIIGIIDWKNVQEQKSDEYLEKYEKNQGSIFVEVYLDDKIYIPAKKMYYGYDNDNSTDITIKFLNDEVTDINAYLLEQGNYYSHPDYNIVGVYAEQGGSEEGLYKNFNWLNSNGGQLDNVKGGSTVKIYLSSKYTLKYYLDDKLYEKDKFTYVPTIAKDIISTNSKNANFIVNASENADLLKSTDVVEYFREDNMVRGEYFTFSYELEELNDEVTILDLPNEKLLRNYWIIKNSSNEMKYRAVPTELMKHEKIEGVDYIFIADNDDIHTIHLYAYTKNRQVDIPDNLIKVSTPGEFSNPETSSVIKIIVVILGVCLLSGVIVYKANKETV